MLNFAYAYQTRETEKQLFSADGSEGKVLPELRNIGYDGVELLVRNPVNANFKKVYAIAEQKDIAVPSLGTGPMTADDALSFTSDDQSVRKEAVDRVIELISWAVEFDASISIGKLRGNVAHKTARDSWHLMREAFYRILEEAHKKDVSILIEPQNTQNINSLNTAYETLEFIMEIDSPNLGIMLDNLHLESEAGDMSSAELIQCTYHQLKFMHLSDSGRLPPGEGDFNIAEVLRKLHELNYSSYIGLEIDQQSASLHTAEKALYHLKSLV